MVSTRAANRVDSFKRGTWYLLQPGASALRLMDYFSKAESNARSLGEKSSFLTN